MAKILVHGAGDYFTLQIELENDCAVTLTWREESAGLRVVLWQDNGELSEDMGLEGFAEWVRRATRR
jgi:hypothetical protein